jgi:hypothetical protein
MLAMVCDEKEGRKSTGCQKRGYKKHGQRLGPLLECGKFL